MKAYELVSIIIPCYNQAQYLEEAVQSAINQTYPNIEIIIVNDGSPDNTQEVADRLKRAHSDIIRVVSQDNQGLSEARNAGIRESLGNYILPLDADDKIDKEIIKQCMDTLFSNQADVIYTDIHCFGAQDNILRQGTSPFNIILFSNIPAATALYRREVWEKNSGYKINMKEGYEDWEFWLNAFENNFKFAYHPEALFFYRIKQESMHVTAKQTHLYLTSKVMMNHSKLYTPGKVKKAISAIKEEEKLADFYFYSDKKDLKGEEQITSIIGSYIQENILQEKQVIDSPNNNIGLCTLGILEKYESIEELYEELNVEILFFYAPLRYKIFSFYHSNFAWDTDKGIIEAKGTVFPYIIQSPTEHTNSKSLAYEHLEIYMEYMDKKIAHKEKTILELKKQIKIRDNIVERFKKLTKSVEALTHISLFSQPYKKIKTYKTLLATYYTVKQENEGS